ncbi:MAG: FxLYD domain-containing protein [Chloroflexi bacterium]|nr:FxLYD domain-containing protein [Chloroflexota bacterium]
MDGQPARGMGIQPPRILQHGFVQQAIQVVFAVVIENPNPAVALDAVQLRMVARDADGAILAAYEHDVPRVAPGGLTYYCGEFYVRINRPVARLTVQVPSPGLPRRATPADHTPFTTSLVRLLRGDAGSQVTGLVHNPFTRPFEAMLVCVVLFDEAEQIVGGGFGYLPGLAPAGASAFAVMVYATARPSRVAVTAMETISGMLGPSDASQIATLTLLEQGWGRGRQAGFGVIVANPDERRTMLAASYLAAAFDAGGGVLAVRTGQFSAILPHSRAAAAGVLSGPVGDAAVAHVTVQAFAGMLVDAPRRRPFSVTSAAYHESPFGPRVTCRLANAYDDPASGIGVVAILRDQAGAIVGGGMERAAFAPVGRTVPIEVDVAGGPVDRAEGYAGELVITGA